MSIEQQIRLTAGDILKNDLRITAPEIELQATKKDFAGDVTLLLFPFVKDAKMSPEALGERLGSAIKERLSGKISSYNVIKGFLNLELDQSIWLDIFEKASQSPKYGFVPYNGKGMAAMVEYSSPNTNKPLHLGHVRNDLLGISLSRLLEASGRKVYKTQIINDRGIHICKSMLAWEKFGGGETPQSSGLKGDKLVGKYYVEFDRVYREQIKELADGGMQEEEAKKEAPIMQEAAAMLLKWEQGDGRTMELWKMMNGWVYEGFEQTYKALGVDFDKNYYESDTYILGKDLVQKGLDKGVFFKKADGSVWIDLTGEGLDEKLVLRSDGTSVYITQDMGTAALRFEEFDIDSLTYVVGNEQDYHFRVLFLILKKLGYPWADSLYHLSYGMVDLPSGKMKSREGTVVDADELIEEMYLTAKQTAEELGKLDGMTDGQKEELYHEIGLGALKYYILKVDPKKRMMFNPAESIDFNGNTGPFIQYTHARICSVLRKAKDEKIQCGNTALSALPQRERELIKQAAAFPEVIQSAAASHSPAVVANYCYELVKDYNSFYQNVSILSAETQELKAFRVKLSGLVGKIIESSLWILGINAPQKM